MACWTLFNLAGRASAYLLERIRKQRGLPRQIQGANQVIGFECALGLLEEHLGVFHGFSFQIAEPTLFQLSDPASYSCEEFDDLLPLCQLLRRTLARLESRNLRGRKGSGIFRRLCSRRAPPLPDRFFFGRRLFDNNLGRRFGGCGLLDDQRSSGGRRFLLGSGGRRRNVNQAGSRLPLGTTPKQKSQAADRIKGSLSHATWNCITASPGTLSLARQRDTKRGAPIDFAREINRAVVKLDDPERHGQANAGTAGLGGKEQ